MSLEKCLVVVQLQVEGRLKDCHIILPRFLFFYVFLLLHVDNVVITHTHA